MTVTRSDRALDEWRRRDGEPCAARRCRAESPRERQRKWALLGLGVVVALSGAAAVIYLLVRDDDSTKTASAPGPPPRHAGDDHRAHVPARRAGRRADHGGDPAAGRHARPRLRQTPATTAPPTATTAAANPACPVRLSYTGRQLRPGGQLHGVRDGDEHQLARPISFTWYVIGRHADRIGGGHARGCPP